jgi:hypothetical protein
MSIVDRLREHVEENRQGMLYDLVFALVWVALVDALFRFVFPPGSPQWAYYLFMLAGIPAYFGFSWSLAMARAQQDE